jgi:hypothetical protein
MVFDNRFMPLMQRPWIASDDGRSHVSTHLFGVRATRAYNSLGAEAPLPDMYGSFDLGKIAQGIVNLGFQNPIKTEWQGATIPWALEGKLQGQGIDLEWQKAITQYISIGGSFLVLRLSSWYNFVLNEKDCTLHPRASEVQELEDLRLSILRQIGICGDCSVQHGFGDTDLYVRVGNYWEYACKFRSIQVGGRLGLLIPTGKHQNIHYPSSIPFGGNGHWGIYGAADALFELKEDWKVGLYLRINQRFARTQCHRVPTECEMDNYAALQTDVRVRPGTTFVFSPYVDFECLRDGLGVRVFYVLTKHWADRWSICQQDEKKYKDFIKRTEWGSDYFSVNVFYDFGKVKPNRTVYPILTFCWDIPQSVLIANAVAKTDRISLGVEVAF